MTEMAMITTIYEVGIDEKLNLLANLYTVYGFLWSMVNWIPIYIFLAQDRKIEIETYPLRIYA